jgi:8-oxo-dGTP pyrophosphatase MutT (NUDIX family)
MATDDPTPAFDERAIAGHEPRSRTATREAAVVVPLFVREGAWHVLFTERATDLHEHPGQVSFPGGGHEPVDTSPTDTALREASEEIGLERSEATIVGRLDDIHTVTDYAVRPFVARIPAASMRPPTGRWQH